MEKPLRGQEEGRGLTPPPGELAANPNKLPSTSKQRSKQISKWKDGGTASFSYSILWLAC